MPDDLTREAIRPQLTTRWLGRSYLYETELGSTNSRLEELAKQDAEQDAEHGTVLVSDRQTEGRGRGQRSWHSPPGLNLYFSVLLRPDWPVGAARPVSLAAGVALAEALQPLLPGAPALKWPNDLLYEDRKLAGILVEASLHRESIRHMIVGIGINVNERQFPDALADLAGSLSLAAGKTFDRGEVLAMVLVRLEHWFDSLDRDGAAPTIARWQAYATWIGQPVCVRNGETGVRGTALGLDARGSLIVRDEQGRQQTVLSGDLEGCD